MRSRLAHRTALSLAAAATLPLWPQNAGGEGLAATLEATATCERNAEPGRVRCTLAVTPRGATLQWVDAVVSACPDFVTPLRARLTPAELGPTGARFAFAVAARSRGRGTLGLRVRAVVCEGPACRAVVLEREVEVAVGPER